MSSKNGNKLQYKFKYFSKKLFNLIIIDIKNNFKLNHLIHSY